MSSRALCAWCVYFVCLAGTLEGKLIHSERTELHATPPSREGRVKRTKMTSKTVSSDGQIQRLRTCSECRLSFSNWEENPLSNSKIWTTYHQTLVFKFASVCEVDNQNFDLRMEISPGYRAKPAASQVVGDMFRLNMAVGNSATVKFTLLQGERIADPATVNSILFSVLDLDKGYKTTHQWLTAPGVNTWAKGYQVDASTSAGGVAKFVATSHGNAGDNPKKSMDLTPTVLGSTVALQFKSTEWSVSLGIDGSDPSGRFFFLAGATALKETFCADQEQDEVITTAPPTRPNFVWRLISDNELYWNLGEIILLRNGVRVNEHANCTASSEYSTTPCSMAFDGITAQDRFSRWSPDWNVENPPYWIQWDAPSADTIQIQQTSHEHTFATLTYSTYSCKLDMKRRKGTMLTFKLAEVCH